MLIIQMVVPQYWSWMYLNQITGGGICLFITTVLLTCNIRGLFLQHFPSSVPQIQFQVQVPQVNFELRRVGIV